MSSACFQSSPHLKTKKDSLEILFKFERKNLNYAKEIPHPLMGGAHTNTGHSPFSKRTETPINVAEWKERTECWCLCAQNTCKKNL